MTDTERAFYAIGGKKWRGYQGAGVAFTLTRSQARDLDCILRAGYLTQCEPDRYSGEIDRDEMTFWHPDSPDVDRTRAELVEELAAPPRCRRTLELFA